MSESKYSVKIRGIYATFLTKLLSEYFNITKATDTIKSRIELPYLESEPDLTITNSREIQKIHVSGKTEAIDYFKQVIREKIPDTIICTSQSGENSIYKGIVIKTNPERNFSIANFGSFKGIIENEIIRPGKTILARVEYPDFGRKKAIVTTNVTIPGLYAVLLYRNRNKISQQIRNNYVRKQLYELGNKLQIKDWGILWRTSAEEALEENEDILIEEVDRLQEKAIQITKRYNELQGVGIILEGKTVISAEFPSHCKPYIDEIRRSIPNLITVNNHHYFKSLNREFSMLVDFSESLALKNPSFIDMINDELSEFYKSHYPGKKQLIQIHHVKVDGRTFYLSPGNLINIENDIMKIKRQILSKKRSTYNGLNILKEPGDYAILTCAFNKWYMRTQYFSARNELKGEYWNINTPIELYFEPYRIRYCDLEIDLIRKPNGEIEIIDQEKLDHAREMDYISENLHKKAQDVVEELKNKLSHDAQPF
ncbi:MAG: DUF402 domain-containing protein [Candidatus Helarchaeales archaeon]